MRVLRRFFSHGQNWLGVFLLLAFVSISLVAPALSPMDPKNPGPFKTVGRVTDFIPHPPDENALLGTLPGQIDVYHTLIWGTRDAMQFGLVVAIGAFLFGVVFGAASGYAGGMLNNFGSTVFNGKGPNSIHRFSRLRRKRKENLPNLRNLRIADALPAWLNPARNGRATIL